MAKISELIPYDFNNIDYDDFIPVVQGGVTKRLRIGHIIEAKAIHRGPLTSTGNGPTRAEIEAIVGGTPTVDTGYVLEDTSGTKYIFLTVYDAADDTWWHERLEESV
jgi:hypothetical protein